MTGRVLWDPKTRPVFFSPFWLSGPPECHCSLIKQWKFKSSDPIFRMHLAVDLTFIVEYPRREIYSNASDQTLEFRWKAHVLKNLAMLETCSAMHLPFIIWIVMDDVHINRLNVHPKMNNGILTLSFKISISNDIWEMMELKNEYSPDIKFNLCGKYCQNMP